MLTLFVYSYGLLFLTSRTVSGQIDSCSCTSPGLEFATGVNLLYYKCDNEISGRISYNITTPEDMINVLNPDKRTIFFIFGYMLYPNHPLIQYIMKALCDGQTDNVVLLDWSKYSNGLYQTVFQDAEKVGVLFAESIAKLRKSNFDVSKIYIIGFSIGAHIAGIADKCNKDFKIPRITALDPANPMFYPMGCYLTNKDASWIDVIHTDMGGYGTPTSVGTADYYVNGGTRFQPGCSLTGLPLSDDDFCSHWRAVELYAKSKLSPTEFIAKRCSLDFNYNPNENETTGIGYAASNVTGSFCVQTGELSYYISEYSL